jgi:hypothetical protein
LEVVKVHNQSVESMRPRGVRTNYEFLPEIDPVLSPEPSAKSRLIDTIATLGDDTLKTVALYELEHLHCRLIRDL